jgi:sporulation protein YlmC with PRC-barrel domain
MLQDLHIGAHVHATDGSRLGTLTRVVVDGTSDRVLALVVDPGLMASGNLLAPGGWERPRERLVTVDLIAAATRDGIHLTCARDAFDQLPHFEQEQFVNADPLPKDVPEEIHRRFHLGDIINYAASEFGLGGAPYLPPAQITYNEPSTAGAIEENTPVWRLEPREQVGHVERVLLDEATGHLAGVVLRRGFPPRLLLLPISAITGIQDGLIEVRLTDDEIAALPLYEPND